MAFNWQTFRIRTITSLIFVGVMLTGLLWNQWSFFILFSIIHFGCWWEYLKLMEKIHTTTFHPYIKLGLMVMGYALMLWFCGPAYQVNGYSIKENISLPVSAAGFALLLTGIFQKNKISFKNFGAALFGLLYISLSWGLMMDLYKSNDFRFSGTRYITGANFIPLVIIAGLWINDTFAYLIGSLFGKHPLTKISPKKTWEGTIGGIILCIALMFFLWNSVVYSIHDNNINAVVGIIATVAAITGVFGDLFESKLKRIAGIKDTGNIMPGHGGFLDRFDSLLMATPFVWLYVQLCIK